MVIDNDVDDQKSGNIVHIYKLSGDVKLIGIEAKDGLYEAVISLNAVHKVVENVCNGDVWHKLLGHYSER